jgi:hypothetical protein
MTFNNQSASVVDFNKTGSQAEIMQMWYSGSSPANVTIKLNDGTTVGPVGPNQSISQNGVQVYNYLPNTNNGDFLTSSGGDRLAWVQITGHATSGSIQVQGLSPNTGTIDVYSSADGSIPFSDHLVPGRLTDFASTKSAIVVGDYVLQSNYTDINGNLEHLAGDVNGALWSGSSGGPTRDGRYSVDITAPGEGSFAAYAPNSYWHTFPFNLAQGGNGLYGRAGATSASAPIVAGAIALLLEKDPQLTADQVRALLDETAVTDSFTGATPNADWGYGKLNILAALDRLESVPEPAIVIHLISGFVAFGVLQWFRKRRLLRSDYGTPRRPRR